MASGDSQRWTKAERLALFSLAFTILGAVAAWLVVPGIPELFGISGRHADKISDSSQPTPSPTPSSAKDSRAAKTGDSPVPLPAVNDSSRNTNLQDGGRVVSPQNSEPVERHASSKRNAVPAALAFGDPSCRTAGEKVICEFTVRNVENIQRRLPPDTTKHVQSALFSETAVTAPIALLTPEPEYTEEAKRAALQGIVELECIVTASGRVNVMKITHSLGMGLDEQARKAVGAWIFVPAKRNGQPVSVQMNIQAEFHLY
jgi:TonB family protein